VEPINSTNRKSPPHCSTAIPSIAATVVGAPECARRALHDGPLRDLAEGAGLRYACHIHDRLALREYLLKRIEGKAAKRPVARKLKP
jgi:hypothetical protein